MRAVTFIEETVRSSSLVDAWRPVIGGLLLIPLAMVTPQTLSAGHGALHLDLGAEVGLGFILLVFVVKIMASTVSLGFGFRGGLFFASLFIGSLAGQLFAGVIAHLTAAPPIDPSDSALIGMAAMASSIIGAPMTMSLLVLETTHDFALTSVAITAALCASTVVREAFGFSFSTWRMHTRGQTIRSARDVGWIRTLTVGKMMQKAPETIPASTNIAEFRRRFPLGSTTNVVLVDSERRYFGIVETARAFEASLSDNSEIGALADMNGIVLEPQEDVRQAMRIFDTHGADFLAVVSDDGEVIGTLAEKFIHRRYTDEMEKAQREMFGE
jgi:CIC family chloride channel protein